MSWSMRYSNWPQTPHELRRPASVSLDLFWSNKEMDGYCRLLRFWISQCVWCVTVVFPISFIIKVWNHCKVMIPSTNFRMPAYTYQPPEFSADGTSLNFDNSNQLQLLVLQSLYPGTKLPPMPWSCWQLPQRHGLLLQYNSWIYR